MKNLIPCVKCSGRGSLPHYGHIIGGVCFRCGGSGMAAIGRPSRRKPKAPAPTIEVFAAVWIHGGTRQGIGSYHETEDGARAACAMYEPAYGHYEVGKAKLAEASRYLLKP